MLKVFKGFMAAAVGAVIFAGVMASTADRAYAQLSCGSVSGTTSVLSASESAQTCTVAAGGAPTGTFGLTAGFSFGTSITILAYNTFGSTSTGPITCTGAGCIPASTSTNNFTACDFNVGACQISTTFRDSANANVNVVLNVANGSQTISSMTLTGGAYSPPPPAVASILPTIGRATGGDPVTITGSGFTGATGVTIGGAAATGVTVVNDTTITATTPAGTNGANASVVVTSASGSNAANALFTYDGVVPFVVSIVRSTPGTSPTNANQVGWIVTFSEPVQGFDRTDISAVLTGATGPVTLDSGVSAITTSTYNASYGNFTLDNFNGTAGLAVNFNPAGPIRDMAGNGVSTAPPTGANEIYVIDNTAPSATLASLASSNADPTRAGLGETLTLTLQFDEAVATTPIVLIAGQAATVSGSGTNFTATLAVSGLTPAGNASINVGGVADAAGNGTPSILATTNGSAVTIDPVAPTVAISGVPANGNAAFTATFTFSEPVNGFTIGDVSVGNGAASAFTGSDGDTVYTALITPAANGTVTVDVAGNAAQDVVGNASTAATQASSNFDATAPTISISSVPGTTNAAFTATFTFSEAVSGFAVADITVVNGSASAFTGSNGDTVYTALVTPTADGVVTIDVASGVAQDGVGNDNTAATQASSNFDGTRPDVAISGVPANSAAPFTATFTFTEVVNGFALGDISVGNGSASALTGSDGDTVYTALITPVANGTVTVDVAENVALDGSGNGNTAAAQASSNFDATNPSLAISGVPADTNAPFTATFTFTEAVNGFAVGDIAVGNGAASAFTGSDGDTLYTALITPAANGTVTIDVAANAAQDGAGNGNIAAAQAISDFDNIHPTVSISGVPANSNSAFTVTFTFSEGVAGVGLADIGIGNGAASALTGSSGDTVYTALITPTSVGAVTIDFASNGVVDAAGNGNTAPAQASSNFDNAAPGVVISGVPSATNSAFTATFTFTEPVNGFSLADVTVGSGAASAFTGSDGDTVYTALITPAASGTVTVDVAANAAQDGVGNPSTAATQASTSFDGDAPGVASIARNSPSTATTDADALTWRVTFSETTQNVDAADFGVTGTTAPVSGVTPVSGSVYDVTVSGGDLANANVTVTLNFLGGQNITDLLGNALVNTTPTGANDNSFNVINDLVSPTVSIGVPDTTNGPFTATLTFSEPVVNFTVGGINVTAGTAGGFTVEPLAGGGAGNTVFTAVITPSGAANDPVSIAVPGGAAQDLAGNANAGSETVSVNFVNEEFVRTRTQRVVKNFLSRRADQLTVNTPSVADRLTRRRGAGGSSVPLGFTASGTLESNRLGFATSLRQIVGAQKAREAARQAGLAEQAAGSANLAGGPSYTGTKGVSIDDATDEGLDIWIKGSLARVESGQSGSDVGQLYIGVDYKVTPNFLWGFLAEVDWTSEDDSGQDTNLDGVGWMIGPYAAARIHDNLIADVLMTVGRSENDVTAAGGAGTFDTNRFLIRGGLTGDFDIEGWQFMPHVGMLYYREEQDSFTNTQGVFIPGQTVSLGRLTFGPEVSTTIVRADGTVLTPRASVKGIWDFEAAEDIDLQTGLASGSDEVRARFEGGLGWQMSNGWRVAGDGFYDGVGAEDFEAYGGNVSLSVPLN